MLSRVREWGARLLLALGSLVLFAAVIEGGARVLVWRWSAEENAVRHPFARYDPLLGWSKPPGARGILRRSEYRVRLEINSLGLRGPEIPLVKPTGVRRLLLLGDSFTEGYTVEDEVSLRGRLEKNLGAENPGALQVINGGTAGWSTDQEVLFYEQTGRSLTPDLVVLLFYYNDLYRDGDLRIQPWFDLDERGALVLRNSPVPQHREFYRAEPFSIKPFRSSVALALLQPRLASHPKVRSFLSSFGLAEAPGRALEIPGELHPFGRQRPREVRRHWERLEGLLRRLEDDIARDGARLVVFYVPARFEVEEGAWELTRQAYGLNAQWDRGRVVSELSRVAAGLSLPFVDPRSAFRSFELKGKSTYFPEDGHWTEAGNEVAATEIVAEILKDSTLYTKIQAR